MKRMVNFMVIAIGTLFLSSCSYNNIISLDEAAKKAWSDVETAYQQRADLIPNIVETVKGESKFEQETLTAIVEARAKATSIQLNADDLTEENMAKFQAAQTQLTGALSRLMAVSENYPQLQATQAYKDLMAELSRTEGTIRIARKDYNEAVQNYNTKIRSFPSNITAGLFKFKQREMFKADSGTENAPKVKF
ncbi:MAG: LemA family protein [Chitinophagales bacterium]